LNRFSSGIVPSPAVPAACQSRSGQDACPPHNSPFRAGPLTFFWHRASPPLFFLNRRFHRGERSLRAKATFLIFSCFFSDPILPLHLPFLRSPTQAGSESRVDSLLFVSPTGFLSHCHRNFPLQRSLWFPALKAFELGAEERKSSLPPPFFFGKRFCPPLSPYHFFYLEDFFGSSRR